MSEWNPKLYLKFQNERTQPVKDLISRINLKNPKRILDIGSGPGNSSIELRKKWTNADIIGIDSSDAMIREAKNSYPEITFLLKDATKNLNDLGTFDLVLSNAAVQWMLGVEKLLPYWFSMLNPGGVMAMQIPNPLQMPIHIAMKKVSAKRRWGGRFAGFDDGLYLHEPFFYYDILSNMNGETDIWETHYQHILPSHDSIVDWYSSTGMKPYLNKLDNDECAIFKDLVLQEIRKKYPVNADGSVIFPFRRIMFMIMKNEE